MTKEQLQELMRQLELEFDARPGLVQVFYRTADGRINNFSISVHNACDSRHRAMSDRQLADLMQREYPATRQARLLAVEHPREGLTRWLDSAEVCRLLHTTRQTVNRWARRGLLHPARLGNRNYYDAAEVDVLLHSHVIQDNGRLDTQGSPIGANTSKLKENSYGVYK